MRVRPRSLEGGWYPFGAEEVRSIVRGWENTLEVDPKRNAGAGIAPHAGWYFSGQLAWDTIRRACTDVQTVVVAGGHRPAGAPVLLATEESFETPLGPVSSDTEFADALRAYIPMAPDEWVDNTVEIQLPLVKLQFPQARVLWLRVPNEERSEVVGASVARAAGELRRKVFFLASTDLTHYGPSYDFTPKGTGNAAYEWMRDVNDRGIINAFLAMDAAEIVRRGNENLAACSSGAVAAAVGFARAAGYMDPRLHGYYTSRDVRPSDSFVGYCSVTYE